jgi:pyruvate, water dikinase
MNILPFSEVDSSRIGEVGGKNASLGEMYTKLSASGVLVPNGFVITASVFSECIRENNIREQLSALLDSLDTKDFSNLQEIGKACRELVSRALLPQHVQELILKYYHDLKADRDEFSVAVRSSATAEDLPGASFAGQHDSFLNVRSEKELIGTCIKCYTSLYNDRAIKYRVAKGFDHMQVLLSIGVQQMVRSDLGSAGVAFTLEPETGHRNLFTSPAYGALVKI